ncbi:hypothetical protein GKZ28_15125 [Clostridium chromiireducens]|uniref:Class II Histidinyl-tRNA synthetase (HisRS)-like catalytic core domain-containing protein n=1 Tax=Clostridium chromiireducens TaxID=225345 RepID=A0A964RNQ0_9CLOT|nr:ATP phosphoribosyltransferase regulatory subunit [Clostridium chromiireducens]MVX65021.1 hypothetical protein [Clostridium chromiireducens]
MNGGIILLVPGVREWFGYEAKIFMDLRNGLENSLLNQNFNYFYGGIVSKKSIYEENITNLGERFIDNCIEFSLNGKDIGTIISPEGTFRVYDYLNRNNKIHNHSGQVFYSQEFLRNESEEDVGKGKTISFWQTGFEIYGKTEIESSLLVLKSLINCFKAINFDEVYFRVSDKRILEGLIIDLPLDKRREIYYLIDKCKEDGTTFKNYYIKKGGDNKIAEKVGQLLDLDKNQQLTLDILDSFTNNSISHNGIEFLRQVLRELKKEHKDENIKIIPFMGKSWDACDSLLFDARLPEYEYAVAGGGNLFAFNEDKKIIKSGAGIGVTRLTEYIIEHKKFKAMEL